jgi:hypothetical protein
VAVRWRDVVEDVAAWQHGEPDVEPVEVLTVGILWAKKKDHILVIRDLYAEQDSGDPVTGGRIAIPKGMIVSLKELNKPE